ncbi:protein of unknown function [Pseudodesulfovibrio piezophilus C1TLV30]|uniref:Uncharacterized protein n=1 Tax=Pseudodesulfovibrio piezophilus (strain DSM 21447 / JCM 15486 / C1TLV30) TaxID=1322246 RepID=M1WMM8_PSEP2|nr:protein of unknown function [Pseudodesulfovibrio piezophilus C1TLV30]
MAMHLLETNHVSIGSTRISGTLHTLERGENLLSSDLQRLYVMKSHRYPVAKTAREVYFPL